MRNKFTNKLALAFGALLMAAGVNSIKAQAGAALNFVAPTNSVVLPQAISTNSLVGRTKITVEAWIKPTTVAGNGCVVSNYSTPSNQMQFLMRRNGSGILFWVGPGNAPAYSGVITAVNTVTAGVWQHVAGVYDGTVASVYINGIFSASATTASNYTFATTTNSIVIGSNAVPESFDGDIDEVRIWNTTRTQCEINTYKNCEIPSNATNLVANYHFNQGTAATNNTTVTTLIDATSNAFTGTLSTFVLTGATSNWVTPGGVVSGFTTTGSCPQAEALQFDGANDNVSIAQPMTSDFTIEYWMKTTQTAATGAQWYSGAGIVDGEIAGVTNDLGTSLLGSKLGFGIGNPDITIQSVSNVNTGVWTHVAATWKQSTGVMKLYINGVLESTGTSATAARTAATNMKLGSLNTAVNFYNGYLDEVRIWNVERTQCEINTYKNCEIPSTAAGLVSNYHFNQGLASYLNSTVTTLTDLSASANTGTLSNFGLNGNTSNWIAPGGVVSGFTTALAPPSLTVSANPALSTCQNNTLVLTASGASTYTWTGGVTNAVAFSATASTIYTVNATVAATGCTATAVANVTANACPGAALSMDGSNDYVNVGNNITNSLVATNKITLEAWVKPRTTSGNGAIVSNYGTNGPPVQFILRRDGGNFTFFTNAAGFVQLTALATVTLNTWTHLAATWDGTVMRYYVNGVPSGSTTNTGSFVASTSQVWIGGETAGPGEFFNGEIDEVRIWNTNRSRCEINTYMNCEIPSNAPNLMANYHFNQGQAFSANATVTALTDATSNALNGTLTNMALTAGNILSNWSSPGGVVSGYTTAVAAPGFTNTALAICAGGSVTLGSTGATSYTWTPSVTNATPFTPTASASYTYAGSNSVTTCSNTAVANVTVNPNPTVTAVSNQTNVICVGQSATLTASGANTYVWNTTATTAVIAISPTVTTAYTVTGTDANGCQNVAVVTQSVSTCSDLQALNSTDALIKVYPNPSSGIFNINTVSETNIEVFDILGNSILKTTILSGDYKLNLSEQSKGLYVVKCTSQGQVKSYRLIKG